MTRWRITIALVVAFVLGALTWASDKISVEGERTIYTVQCQGGTWEGPRCTGTLVAGDLHRFRASKSRHEVLYWVAGSTAPSGKYSDCKVVDRGNWKCNAGAAQPPTITHEMEHGRPVSVAGGSHLPFHAVRKLEWWLLRAGIHVTNVADGQVVR
jgi:hypothetical protein